MIAAQSSSPHRGKTVREWLQIVKRRRVILAASLVVALALAALLMALTPPRYTAEASLVLEARKVQVILQDAVISRLPQESPVLRTELDVISSRSLAERVMEKLGGEPEPEAPPSLARSTLAWLRGLLPFSAAQPDPKPPASPEDKERAIIDRLLGGLRVSNDGRSFTIFIAYTSFDPVYAARVANAFAEAYLEQQTRLQAGATRQASEWLGKKLGDLRTAVEYSEAAVAAFRREAGLIEANGAPLKAQQLNALNAELAVARASRTGAEARLDTARMLAKQDGGAASFPEVLGSPVIQLLRKDKAELTRQLTALEDAGASKSVQIPAIRSQLASLDQQIAAETDRVLVSLANEVEVARRKEEGIKASFDTLQADYADSSQAMIHLNQLEREAEANRTVYESFLNRYKQTMEQEGLATPEARLVSRAEPPFWPSTARLPIIIFALIGGVGAGLALALVAEGLDDRVRSLSAIEEATGAPVIGQIPEAAFAARVSPADHPVKQRASAYSQAFAKLQAAIRLSPLFGTAKVIMVTSAVPHEGKTSVAVSLARVMALGGEKVLVIDADWRRPAIAGTFGGVGRPGLAELIRGEASGSDVTQVDIHSGAHFIAPGVTSGLPESALAAAPLVDFIAQCRQRYDAVLIDTPPVLASADAALIGSSADAALFVVRWGATSARDVVASLRELALCGTQVSGIVMDGVDPRRHAHYEAVDQTDRDRSPGAQAGPRDRRPRAGGAIARQVGLAAARIFSNAPAKGERS
ncbi:GumC family protein [Chelatococcus sp. GCM10030263]|uniref:GumC family protein n=1 Tax=Chelatococcus sp. GCM10030263 TaxID=3273387 RepID=UPI00362177FE